MHAAAGLLLCGADPGIILDEEDDVRAVAIGAALELAMKWSRNHRQDLANRIAQCLSNE